MVQNSHYKDDLKAQITEAYGKVTYTYTAHHKLRDRLDKRNRGIKTAQIFLSGVSTFGFVGTLITNSIAATWIAGVFAALLLIINLYFKDFNLPEQIAKHRNAADDLWLIRDQYLSLLTDFPVLSENEISMKRDEMQNRTNKIYKHSPETDEKSYKEAQNALKNEEEQFFSTEELDKMLPSHLRSGNSAQTGETK